MVKSGLIYVVLETETCFLLRLDRHKELKYSDVLLNDTKVSRANGIIPSSSALEEETVTTRVT